MTVPSIAERALALPAKVRKIRNLLIAVSAACALFLVSMLARCTLGPLAGGRRGDAVVAVLADDRFGAGAVVVHDGRVVVLTAYSLVRATNDAKAYVYQSAGDTTVAVGFAATVVAVDRDAGVAVLSLDGITPSDVSAIKISANSPLAIGTNVSVAGSRARFADDVRQTVTRRKASAGSMITVPAKVSAAEVSSRGPKSDTYTVSGEDVGGPGFIGAPVLDPNGRLAGIATDVAKTGLVVAPSEVLSRIVSPLTSKSFDEPSPQELKARLEGRLEKVGAKLRQAEEEWHRLSWPRFVSEARPDRLGADRLSALGNLPSLDGLLAPSDIATLKSEAADKAKNITEAEERRQKRGEPARTITEEQALRAIGLEQLRRLLGIETAKVVSVTPGPVRLSYVAQIIDGYDENHEICVVVEHGDVFPSVRPCGAASRSRPAAYPWFRDREMGEQLVGKWRQVDPDEKNGRRRREADPQRNDRPCRSDPGSNCLGKETVLTITSVKGSFVRGSLTTQTVAYWQPRDGAPYRVCSVPLTENVVGRLVNGVVRLLGKTPQVGDLWHAGQGSPNQQERAKTCLEMEPHSHGAVPHAFGTNGQIRAQDILLDLQIKRGSGEEISVTPAWRGAVTPWQDSNGSPAKIEMRWIGDDGLAGGG